MFASLFQLMRRDVTRGVAGTILLKVGSGGLAFALFSLAARAMSPEAFGDFATWLSIAQIASVVGLIGQELLLVRFLNEYDVGGRADLTKGVLLSSLRSSAIAMLLSISAIAAVAGIRGEWWLLILSVSAFTAVNAGLMLGSQIARSLVSILMGEGNREFFWRVAVVLLLIAALFGHRQLTPAELFTAMTVAMLAGLLVQIASIVRVISHLRDVTARFETSRWRTSAFRFWLSSILEAANQYFDVILVYWMLDPATAGVYFAASRLANIFAMLSAALYTFGARRLPSLYFSKNHDELEHTLKLMAEVTALCVLSGLLLVWVGAPYLLGLFGPHFVAQQWVLIVLAIGTAFQAAGGPAAAILQLTGHEREYVPVVAANVVLRLVGFLVLIPWLGVLGAAISATVSLALATTALNVLCRKRTGLDPSILVLCHFASDKTDTYAVGTADSND
ncbi:polysaccharide biosynthesis C-terminal domain-containing protein [Bradyrhizobium sp. ISRA443]|uniref:lipopolysaccharide biosynthesis protein n=1 Tax=unclassified Bradyrhizobium TaxID=2631580 RepID=UPI00247B079D|nr:MULTISPECIES: polysaccharide biosynthesis C-terminal domain-containing protein [unclassified Bradyrhizobium]WGR93876.1 polysaccharide biosynthesis C-terminal domain-containing protein [Bradyrhizobium sp. ISRA435]WGR98499.1 polysaccharide biosynthesis C-terminal domain-containing protein [Bradyrhizobium sp. ISRA436]WGS05388.1 polysaccharide biosynthesis C-terminal domain-containing protein [Bradyrhizobium sp. ISRA437]WGS12274.1 polysaccharide biosynthesis C-terminal domain-containing protein 